MMESNLENIKGFKVFVTGAFDIIHPGHIYFLKKAKQRGEFLVVGLLSDKAVSKFKEDKRPIVPFEERKEILLSIEFVDFVIPVENLKNSIEKVKPDLIMKCEGDNYFTKDEIKSFKGKIINIKRLEPFSISYFIKKILKSKKD